MRRKAKTGTETKDIIISEQEMNDNEKRIKEQEMKLHTINEKVKKDQTSVFDIFRDEEAKKKKPKPVESIADFYRDLEFSQQYGNNIFLVVLLLLFLVLFYFYFNSKTNSQKTIDNWPVERCKPQNILMAGMINKPADKTATEYTSENFSFCVNNVLKQIIGSFMQPFNYLATLVVLSFQTVSQSINDMRGLFDMIRADLLAMLNVITSMLMSFIIPLQQMIITLKDMLSKTQAIMVTGLFTILCFFYAAIDVVGAIISLSIMVIVVLVAMLCVTYILTLIPIVGQLVFFPIYAGIYVFFIIITVALLIVIVICTKLQSAYPAFCFDADTAIALVDGTAIPIRLLQVGQRLKDNSYVTAIMKMDATGVRMYELGDICVGGAHYVQYKEKWIQVEAHPCAKRIEQYDRPFIYCLNTSSKEIRIGGTVFSDWDDLFDPRETTKVYAGLKVYEPKKEDIHVHNDGGFSGDTVICMGDGTRKQIQQIEPGEMLYNRVKVGGVVVIDGSTVSNQFSYIGLGNSVVTGGPHLVIQRNGAPVSTLFLEGIYKKPVQREDRLYHLITDRGFFHVDNDVFYDYNSLVEFHTDGPGSSN